MGITVLVTGADGQLGSEIRQISAGTDMDFHFSDVCDTDLTDPAQAGRLIDAVNPGYVINCAAYTAVDRAESEPATAEKVNAGIPANLLRATADTPARIIHISTDYVFSGTSNRPLSETDETGPQGAYGKSKLKGEQVLRDQANAMIIRTSWLYSSYGRNFVKSMVGLLNERDELNVVFDQVGSPTYAADLAAAIVGIVSKSEADTGRFTGGIFHYANEGVASWYDIVMEIKNRTGSDCRVNPILTKDYPLPAPRPVYSVFNKQKIRQQFGLRIPYWKDSLHRCLDILTP